VSFEIIISTSVIRSCFTHKTTPYLQDQDRFFLSQIGLVLRQTVSDHVTSNYTKRPETGRLEPTGIIFRQCVCTAIGRRRRESILSS